MKKIYLLAALLALAGMAITAYFLILSPGRGGSAFQAIAIQNTEIITLPPPVLEGTVSLEQALLKRRSVRAYLDQPLSLAEVGQLLWAAQGITDPARGYRSAPSAGALYPLELYLAAGNVEELAAGVYRYDPRRHALVPLRAGDVRAELAAAAVNQSSVRDGAAVIVFSAVYERTTQKYGERGMRYVHMEAGHAAQNAALQAVSLDLGMVVVGAFDDQQVKQLLNMPQDEQPLYILPVGRISN